MYSDNAFIWSSNAWLWLHSLVEAACLNPALLTLAKNHKTQKINTETQ